MKSQLHAGKRGKWMPDGIDVSGSAPQLVNGKAHDLGRITTASHHGCCESDVPLPVQLREQLQCACWPERQTVKTRSKPIRRIEL